jgi:predicted dehydrogenase
MLMRAGIVGFGFMGWIHYLAYQQSSQAELVAFCSRDQAKRSGDFRSVQGNFGPPGSQVDVTGMNVYADLSQMLSDDSIDMIDICLPPDLHAEAIEACWIAGKPCLCEKPLTLDYASAKSLADRAELGQLMVAHILPLMNEFQFLYQAAKDLRYGKPISGRFKRSIGPPDWIPDFYDPSKVGGPLLDLHVHDAHLIRLLFGMPTDATCVYSDRDGVPKAYETVFEFESPESEMPSRIVSSGGGVIDSPARPFTHGYEVSFEKATIQFEFAAYADGSTAIIPVTVMHNDGRIDRPDLGSGDPIEAFVRELDLAAACVDRGQLSDILDARIAADAIKICELQRGV